MREFYNVPEFYFRKTEEGVARNFNSIESGIERYKQETQKYLFFSQS